MNDRVFPIPYGRSEWGDSVTEKWDVELMESASGMFRGLVQQDLPKFEYTVKFPHLTKAEKDELIRFVSSCKGKLIPFFMNLGGKMKNQVLHSAGNGFYQLVTNTGEIAYKVENVKAYSDGAEIDGFTVSNGKLATASTGVISASYDYYEYVRFANEISITQKHDNLYSCTIKVVTAR